MQTSTAAQANGDLATLASRRRRAFLCTWQLLGCTHIYGT
jgi:hypothetical protein